MEGYTKTEVGLAEFSTLIRERFSSLQNYASSPKCNQFYIKKEQEFINKLIDINNTIEGEYERLGKFEGISKSLENLLLKNCEIGEVIIRVKVHPRYRNQGIIEFNYFK